MKQTTVILAIVLLAITALVAAPALAQTKWTKIGANPSVLSDSVALWISPTLTAAEKDTLWMLWKKPENRKAVGVPRGTIEYVVSGNRWIYMETAWEVPQRFGTLPAEVVEYQLAGSSRVAYFGKYQKQLLLGTNCGNQRSYAYFRSPQLRPVPPAITQRPPAEPQPAAITTTWNVSVTGNGKFYNFNQTVTGNGSSATIGDVSIDSHNTYPQATSGTLGNPEGTNGTDGGTEASNSHGTNSIVTTIFDYLDVNIGIRTVELSNNQGFDVGYVGVDAKVWGPFGILGEYGLGRDGQFRPGFPLPVRNEYKALGVRAELKKDLFVARLAFVGFMVGDEIRQGNTELGAKAGESFQSAQTVLGASLKLQYGPVYVEGSLAGAGDFIDINNQPKEVNAKSIAVGVSAKGLIETLKKVF